MEKRKLCNYMYLMENGELQVEKQITTILSEKLCEATRCNSFEYVYSKLKKEAKVRIKTKGCYYKDVFSASKSIVEYWTKSLSFHSVPGLNSKLDLVKGKYEGGFKVWESTGDLIQFLATDSTIMDELLHEGNTLNVLELGAGAALPSLALLSRLIGDSRFKSPYQIHVQDYNWQVLSSLTLINFAINLPLDYLEALLDTECLRFFHGDWKDFSSDTKYDLIMMSEVIYNSENYEHLHNLLERQLVTNGYIFIATKNTYFGLTGDLYSWLEYVDSKGLFYLTSKLEISSSNIPRSLLIMRKINK